MGLYHYIGGDYRFTSYNYVTCINVMSRRIVMVACGVMYDIRQSRATRKLSDWRGASRDYRRANWCAGPRGWVSWAGDFRANRRIL